MRSRWLGRAFEDTPREVFVPRCYRRSASGQQVLVDGADPAQREQWLSGVHTDDVLTVQLTPAPATTPHCCATGSEQTTW